MESQGPDQSASPQAWFVQAAGRVWGPYPGARIQAFVREGRLTPQTPLGRKAEGPFAPAGEHRGLRELFARAQAKPAGEPGPPVREPARPRALVVWADLTSLNAEAFEGLLDASGACARIRPGLWLVKAKLDPAALRNALSRRLGDRDALVVLDAPLDRAAWFNLGGGERALRHLWGEGD